MFPTDDPYDRVPYPGRAYSQTHPDRLAVMGTLFGMRAPDVEHCRVLEIGCGDGANLIPMAFGLPQSEFVGLDLANGPIGRACGVIDRLGLKNIQARHLDLIDLGPEFGQFDYIIAHGVYSWVPASVQEKLLTVCKQNLTPNGMAFISYNANPGGQVRRILRDIMMFRTNGIRDPERHVPEGKAFLEFVLENMPTSSPWRMALQGEFEKMCARTDNVIYHDELGTTFSPVYFADFVERAMAHGLQFVSEAKLADDMTFQLDATSGDTLRELVAGDVIGYQQSLDFIRFRKFRQTLLCNCGIPLHRDNLQQRLDRLLVASPLRLSSEYEDGVAEFTNGEGSATIKTNNPITIATLRELERTWPRGERFAELCGVVCALVPNSRPEEVAKDMSQAVMNLAASTLLDLRTYNPPIADQIADRPTASRLARLQAPEGFVTTLMHTHLTIKDGLSRRFLQLLDGTRDRRSLVDSLAADDPEIPRNIIAEQVDNSLEELYRKGLLTR